MKDYRIRHWMLMALMVLCIGGLTAACEETEDEEIPEVGSENLKVVRRASMCTQPTFTMEWTIP